MVKRKGHCKIESKQPTGVSNAAGRLHPFNPLNPARITLQSPPTSSYYSFLRFALYLVFHLTDFLIPPSASLGPRPVDRRQSLSRGSPRRVREFASIGYI